MIFLLFSILIGEAQWPNSTTLSAIEARKICVVPIIMCNTCRCRSICLPYRQLSKDQESKCVEQEVSCISTIFLFIIIVNLIKCDCTLCFYAFAAQGICMHTTFNPILLHFRLLHSHYTLPYSMPHFLFQTLVFVLHLSLSCHYSIRPSSVKLSLYSLYSDIYF